MDQCGSGPGLRRGDESVLRVLIEEWNKARNAGRNDKASLDIFPLEDGSLANSDNLPPPELLAQQIVDDLEAALEQFRLIAGDLNGALAARTA